MNELTMQLLTGAIGGAIITSIVGPLVLNSGERRKARAQVLEAIYEVEVARWRSGDNTLDNFRSAVVKLRAIALIAKANQDLLDHYIYMASVGMYASMESFEYFGGDEEAGAGFVDTTLVEGIRMAADELLNTLWHPVFSRLIIRQRIAALKRSQKQLRKTVTSITDNQPINWDIRV